MALSKVITYNPTEVTEINWVTENFPVIGDIIHSPVIQPIPNCAEKWRIMLQFSKDPHLPNVATRSKVEVFLLKDQSCIEKSNVKLVLHFKYDGGDGFQVGSDTDLPVSTGKENSYLLHSFKSRYIIPQLYKYNKLDVNAKLTVSGYRVYYSSSPHPVIDLDDNCQGLSRDLERLYVDTTSADITFLVEGRKLFSHSAIIRCRSIVLAKMLDQDMLERRTRCVRITDASFQVFDCFLRYLYTAKVNNKSWDTMFNLYPLADKYSVSALKTICSRWLGMNLKVDTVSKCLSLAALHEDMELKQESMQFIRNHLSDVLDTSDWKQLVSNLPQLASETLSFVTSRV
ncbi:Protein roadkill [Araneus ventricosus]|uniref:Protein roadkill n=1 Tax=Araneus ventricosus TaxID=182803 RepID=A0A4Y2BIT9_ARAVE|nr:Protein roadkill [Araneus ventricosus]